MKFISKTGKYLYWTEDEEILKEKVHLTGVQNGWVKFRKKLNVRLRNAVNNRKLLSENNDNGKNVLGTKKVYNSIETKSSDFMDETYVHELVWW